MTNPHTLIPSTLPGSWARPRALRASSMLLCAIGLLGAVACGDNTGDDVIQPSRSGSEERAPTTIPRATNPGTDDDGPGVATGTTDDDETGIDDEDDIAARSGGTRATGGGGGSRRRTNDIDDEDEIESDAGVDIDAGDVDAGVDDAGVVVEDAGVVEEDAGVVDAG